MSATPFGTTPRSPPNGGSSSTAWVLTTRRAGARSTSPTAPATARCGTPSIGVSNATLDAYEDIARTRIHDIVAGWPDGEPFDLAAELVVFPMVILGDLMNLPEQDWPSLVELSTTAVAYDDARPARIALFSYLQRTLHERKRNPMDDLFASLMSTEVEGRKLASADVVCNTYNVLLGANVTLPHTASSTLLTLMELGLYREWAESPEATSTGLDEAIRWGTAANHFLRYTTQDVELPGGTIPAGDAVALWLSSANRDEEVFDDPYTFDIRRQPNKHLGFGVGSHYCVGYAMAKLCLRILFEEIIVAVEDFEPAGPVEHLRSNLVAGYVHIPVVVRRRRRASANGQRKEPDDS